MQAIITKYLPATNVCGNRIKASCARGSITVSCPHELSEQDCHRYAVEQLVGRFAAQDAKEYGTPLHENPWRRPMVCGQYPDGRYVFVFTDSTTGNS